MMNNRLGIANLDIDNLSNELETISKDSTRITRAKIDDIFRLIRYELPHSNQVITATLANTLYADSPLTDTSLNELIYQLGRALYTPANTQAIIDAEKSYYDNRKTSEKVYAVAVTDKLLELFSIDEFPAAAHLALKELALTITEKIINEKQSRRVPGYKPQSVLEIVRPFLYFRLASQQIESVKVKQPQLFRKWIIDIGQDGYELINDEKIFRKIREEKQTAFNEFKSFVTTKSLNKSSMARAVDKIRFSQQDRNKRQTQLGVQLQTFLNGDTQLEKGLAPIKSRFHDQLNRLFNASEKNTDGLRSEEAISSAHNLAFDIIETDFTAIKNIVGIFVDLEKKYLSNFLASLLAKKNIALVNDTLIDSLLGSPIQKRDPIRNEMRTVRDGGYPQKSIRVVFDGMTGALQKLADKLSGPFTGSLKSAIQQALSELNSARGKLTSHPDLLEENKIAPKLELVPPVEEVKPVVEEPIQKVAEAPAPVDEPKPIAEEPEPVQAAPEENKISDVVIHSPFIAKAELNAFEPKAPEAETPTVLEETPAESPDLKMPDPGTPLASSIETPPSEKMEHVKIDLAAIEGDKILPTETKLEPVTLAPVTEAEKIEEEKLVLPEDDFDIKLEPLTPVVAKDESAFEEPVKAEEPVFEEPKMEEPKIEAPVIEETKEEKIIPPPLQLPDDFDDIPIVLEPVAVKPPEPAVDPTGGGPEIIKEYQLGEFETAVQNGWKAIQDKAAANGANSEEQKTHLKIICELVQKVAAFNPEAMTTDKKEMLESITTLLLAALQDPLDENNWTFFEGKRRDDVDRAVAAIGS